MKEHHRPHRSTYRSIRVVGLMVKGNWTSVDCCCGMISFLFIFVPCRMAVALAGKCHSHYTRLDYGYVGLGMVNDGIAYIRINIMYTIYSLNYSVVCCSQH